MQGGMDEFGKGFGNVDAALRTLGRDQGRVGRGYKGRIPWGSWGSYKGSVPFAWGGLSAALGHHPGGVRGAPGSGEASSAVKLNKKKIV